MKTYRPKSWSQQAREMCNEQVWQIKAGFQTVEGATEFFSNSYRPEIITGRAAKRFGRMLKAGKVK